MEGLAWLQAYICRQEKGHPGEEGKKSSPFTRVGTTDGEGPICHISKSFVRARWMHENQVVVLDEEIDQEQPSWVQPCSTSFKLNNWQILEGPEISMSNPM